MNNNYNRSKIMIELNKNFSITSDPYNLILVDTSQTKKKYRYYSSARALSAGLVDIMVMSGVKEEDALRASWEALIVHLEVKTLEKINALGVK